MAKTRSATKNRSLTSNPSLNTKCIYDPHSPSDGVRVLVMSFWPRGVARNHVDVWFRELGTAPSLIKEWKAEQISWTEFRRHYRRGLQEPAARQAVVEIRRLLSSKPV